MKREDIVEAMARAISRYEGYGEFITSIPRAQAALATLEALGLVIVPREPTEAMIDAAFNNHSKAFQIKHGRPPTPEEDAAEQWAAMLAASPIQDGEG